MTTLDELLFALRTTHYSLAEAAHIADMHRESIRRLALQERLPGATRYGSHWVIEKTAFNGWVADYEGRSRRGVTVEQIAAIMRTKQRALTKNEIADMTGTNRNSIKYHIKKMLEMRVIEKIEGTRPHRYKLLKET